jgi:hypothetical protein
VFVKNWVFALLAIAVCSASVWASPASAGSCPCGDDASGQQWQKAIVLSESGGDGAALPGQVVPSTLPQRQDPGQQAPDLPGLPSTLLLSLAGFLCVTLVRDRRAWLAIPFAVFAAVGSLGRAISREAERSEATRAAESTSLLPGAQAQWDALHAGRYLVQTHGGEGATSALSDHLLGRSGDAQRPGVSGSARVAHQNTCPPPGEWASLQSYLLVGLLPDSGFASVRKPSVFLTFQRAPPLCA